MAWVISYQTYLDLFTIHLWMIWIILFGVPGVCLVLFLCSPVCCCLISNRKEKCCRAIHNILLSTAEQLFWFLKKEEKDWEKCLFIAGLIAPAGYTYFLLYAFLLLTVHCLFAFFDASVNIYYTVNYPGVKVVIALYFYMILSEQSVYKPQNGDEKPNPFPVMNSTWLQFATVYLQPCLLLGTDLKKKKQTSDDCPMELRTIQVLVPTKT